VADLVLLHIGQQKSGTTYLQEVLRSVAGKAYPLPPGRRPELNHEHAMYGLLGTEFPWVSAERAAACQWGARWLVDTLRAARKPVVLSAEALSALRTPAIRHLAGLLGSSGDVTVVITARSLCHSLPSSWQQHVRNGRRRSMSGYLTAIAAQRSGDVEGDRDLHFWRAYGLSALVRRWADVVGIDRVRLVTNPGHPPDLLWHRFAEAAGLSHLRPRPEQLTARVHTALTAPEMTVLVALNALMEEGEDAVTLRDRVVEAFISRPDRGPRVTLSREWRERIAPWIAGDLEAVAETGVAIVGDLDDLRICPAEEPPITPEQVAAAAASALHPRRDLATSPDPQVTRLLI
jgi:hypothetical protein